MSPQDPQPMSRPVPTSSGSQNMDDITSRPAPAFGHVPAPTTPPTAPPQPTVGHLSSTPPPSRGGGKGVLIVLLLLFVIGTGVFGYLWWQGRNATPVAVVTPTPTPVATTQSTKGSYVFSTVGTKNTTFELGVTAASAYRLQLGAATTNTQAYVYNSVVLPTAFTLNVADGYQGSDSKGHHIGELYVVDITEALKKDDPASTTNPFGGSLKAADKQASVVKLQTLLDKSETNATAYMDPTVFNPFGNIATTTAWQAPEILDIGNGFKGYTLVGLPLGVTTYTPASYTLIIGKIKDAAGADRTIMAVSKLALNDDFSESLLTSQGTTEEKVASIKKKLEDIKSSSKFPDDTIALQKQLVTVYKTLTLQAETK